MSTPREYELQDSGERQTFPTGAQRDSETGKGRFDLLSPYTRQRDAILMEKGAAKYDARNWEKGMPFSRFLDSALRHLNKYQLGLTDEDHLAAARWNIGCIMHLEATRPELNDLPKYESIHTIRELVDESQLEFDFMTPSPKDDPNYITLSQWLKELQTNEATPQPSPQKPKSEGRLRIYVAGPFSSPDEGRVRDNITLAECHGGLIAEMGHFVHVPHAATGFMHDPDDPRYEYFMDLSFSIIDAWADALYVIDRSPGTNREIEFAAERGIPVYWDLADIPPVAEREPATAGG